MMNRYAFCAFSEMKRAVNKVFFVFCEVVCFARLAFSAIIGGSECVRCEKPSGFMPLCKSCMNVFYSEALGKKKTCKICGKTLLSETDFCVSCRTSEILTHTDGVFSLCDYRFWKKELLFSWKMRGNRAISPFFANLVYKKMRKIEDSLLLKDIPVVPVPPRPGKIRKNGWDQINEICFYLKRFRNIKILKLLKRVSDSQQKKLNREERLDKIVNTYVLSSAAKKNRNIPESVFLIDDVITTGATVEQCARLLKSLGVKRVYVITLFIVD